MQCAGWMLPLMGLLAVVASSATLPASAAALNPQPTSLRAARLATTSNDRKDAGFTNCCQSKGVFEKEGDLSDCCTYSQLACPFTTLEALPGQQQSDWVKCFGDSQDDTDCCAEAGLGSESLYSCDYFPPVMNYTRWVEPIQEGYATVVGSCAMKGAYNEADGSPSSESSEHSSSEEGSGSDEEDDSEQSSESSEGEEEDERDAGFYDCCEENGLFESEADRHRCCNYTAGDWATDDCRPLVEGFTSEEKSDLLKCYGDSRNNTDCCVENGVGQESLYACDYSTPHVDFDQWNKAVASADWFDQAAMYTCDYANAYNGSDW